MWLHLYFKTKVYNNLSSLTAKSIANMMDEHLNDNIKLIKKVEKIYLIKHRKICVTNIYLTYVKFSILIVYCRKSDL